MIRFFRKLFKRGDFMTRADKAYYKYRAKTIFWSAFCLIIIAWVGTNLVLCALTTNVTSNFDMIYEVAKAATLPTGREFDSILRNIDESNIEKGSADRTIKNIVFDKFTNKEVDVYKDESGTNLIASAEKTTLNVDDEIYLYRANGGANIYVLSNRDMYANEDSSHMFRGLSYGPNYGNPEGISITFNNFHTDEVKNMSYMFAGGLSDGFVSHGSYQGFKELDLSGWNTSKVTDMSWMFYHCWYLKNLNVEGWDTKNVTTMASMFHGLSWDGGGSEELFSLDLSSFDTRNVVNMVSMFDYQGDFYSGLQTIYVSDRFVVDQVEKSIYMFAGCGNLVGQQGTKCTGNWNGLRPPMIDENDEGDETVNKTYAYIDGKDGHKGYFTEKPYSGK